MLEQREFNTILVELLKSDFTEQDIEKAAGAIARLFGVEKDCIWKAEHSIVEWPYDLAYAWPYACGLTDACKAS